MAETPAGWHKDVNGVMRWWDGTQWTEQTQPDPAAAAPKWAPPVGGAPTAADAVSFDKAAPVPPPAGPPIGGPPMSPYGNLPSGGGNKKLWWIIGGIAVAGVVVVGGIIGIIAVAVHNAGDEVTSATKSLDAAQSELNDWATSSSEPDPSDEFTDDPTGGATGDPTEAAVPEPSTFTPSRADKDYPHDKFGIVMPAMKDANAAPKNASVAAYCQLDTAEPAAGGDLDDGTKKQWDEIWLGTPADMPALARKGWAQMVAPGNGWDSNADDAWSNYDLKTAHCY